MPRGKKLSRGQGSTAPTSPAASGKPTKAASATKFHASDGEDDEEILRLAPPLSRRKLIHIVREKREQKLRGSKRELQVQKDSIARHWIRKVTISLVLASLLALATQVFELEPPTEGSTRAKNRIRVETIPLNENATLAKDLISITHHRKQAKLEVTLKSEGRCPRPYLVGRLTGPALIKVENWTWTGSDKAIVANTTTLVGYYQAPVGGMYFVEIIALYCDDQFYYLNRRNETASEMFQQQKDWNIIGTPITNLLHVDFHGVCMEDPFNHRLTPKGTMVSVDHKTALAKQKQRPQLGYWWFNDTRTTWGNPEDVTIPSTATNPPLSPQTNAPVVPKTNPPIPVLPAATPPPGASTDSPRQKATKLAHNCKMYMVASDKNLTGYMSEAVYIDWLNKMSLPNPSFVGSSFEALPKQFQDLYRRFANLFSATNQIDIHGAWEGTQPSSPAQGASLTLLCNEADTRLRQHQSRQALPSKTRSLQVALTGDATPVQPIYTRIQPPTCLQAHIDHRPLPPECIITSSVHGFDKYEYRWTTVSDNGRDDNSKHPGLTVADLQQPEPTVICVMGHSHARTLWHGGERLGLKPGNPTNVIVEWTDARYPQEVNPASVQHYLKQKKCSKLIIAVGQWPASYVDNKPQGLMEYYMRIKGMLQSLKDSGVTEQIEISLRSIHYIALGSFVTSCPPKGWRNPLVIDAYNSIIERVCWELGFPFYDTNFLVGPVWDSAPDWCHLNDHTSEQEMLWLAATVLGIKRGVLADA